MIQQQHQTLPKFDIPSFIGTVPSSGQTFEFRPFLVKEQKNLLIAMSSKNTPQIYSAFKSIIESCIKSFNGTPLDLNRIPIFDLESMFLQISAKSVGERSTIIEKCKQCQHENEIDIVIDDVKLKNYAQGDNKVMLSDSIGIIFKYPSIQDAIDTQFQIENQSDSLNKPASSIESAYRQIVNSIESIFDANQVYLASDLSKEELTSFLDQITIQQMQKIDEFFKRFPYLAIDVNYICQNCRTTNQTEIRGLQNFFL